eukprot:jgi/Mesen1/3674/ME000202S02761
MRKLSGRSPKASRGGNARPFRSLGPCVLDPLLVPRVEQYQYNNGLDDLDDVVDYLRRNYKEYQRKQQGPFRRLVERAVQVILQRGNAEEHAGQQLQTVEDLLNAKQVASNPDECGEGSEGTLDKVENHNHHEVGEGTEFISPVEEDMDRGHDRDGLAIEGRAREGDYAREKKEVPIAAAKIEKAVVGDSCNRSNKADQDSPKTFALPQTKEEKQRVLDAELEEYNKQKQQSARKRSAQDAFNSTPEAPGGQRAVRKKAEHLSDSLKKSRKDSGPQHPAPAHAESPGEQAMQSAKAVPRKVTFRDLGGIEGILQIIRELIEYPLAHPELYKWLGVEPPRGVLLHGPPGCGKTMLAHAIAVETGESEAKIRGLFAEAKNLAPCIVFIDEIDAITPKRETAQREMERRIVAQLLTCIDDLNQPTTASEMDLDIVEHRHHGHVVIIGATNRPDSLDPALRRAGRFDREITLGIPDEDARARILEVLAKRLRLEGDFDFKLIARRTPGFVGADLAALTKEAAAIAVQRIFSSLDPAACSSAAPKRPPPLVLDAASPAGGPAAPPSLNLELSISSGQPSPAGQPSPTGGDMNGVETGQLGASSAGSPEEQAGDVGHVVNTSPQDEDADMHLAPMEEGKERMMDLNKEYTEPSERGGACMEVLESHAAATCNGIRGDHGAGQAGAAGKEGKLLHGEEPRADHTEVQGARDPNGHGGEEREESWRKRDEDRGGEAGEGAAEPKVPTEGGELWKRAFTRAELQMLHITMADFEVAVGKVQPSAKREGFTTIPDVTWDDVGSLGEVREELEFSISRPIKCPEEYQAMGLDLATGVLLYGPPGCGKTLVAKAIANDAGANFISIKGPELLNKYVGESERAVRQLFMRARSSAPCVLFFDELLTEMDGLESRKSVYLIAATNRPDMIDAALLRPGRLDKLLYVPLPDPAGRASILRTLVRKIPLAAGVDVAALGLSRQCDGFSGADLAALVREACIAALRERTRIPQTSVTCGLPRGPPVVNASHFSEAFIRVMPSVSPKDVKRYDELRQKLRRVRGHIPHSSSGLLPGAEPAADPDSSRFNTDATPA